MKRILLPAFLVALAFLAASCGGDDKQDDPAPAAATSEPAQSEQPAPGADEPEPTEQPSGEKNGDGGSSASDAERAAGEDSTAAPAEQETSERQSKPAKRKRDRKLTPQERLAALSPAERRKLDKDLYEQGKRLCATYGPEQLAKSIDLPNRDPETVARLYARAYEAATPALALPYQQGCLVGFKRFARKQSGN